MNWSPQDLPYIRDICHRSLLEFITRIEAAPYPAQLDETLDNLRTLATVYEQAALTWLDADVSDMVAETAGSLPEWTPSTALPGDFGLMAFETPVGKVKAIAWGVDGGNVTITWLGDVNHFAPLDLRFPLEDIAKTTIALDNPVSKKDSVAALAGAAWLLMGQRTLIEDATPVEVRVKQKGKAKATFGAIRPVIVSYKRLNATYRAGTAGGQGQKATKRWWVRGHWRQQAWGKNREQRKPIFIAPHTAGAVGVDVDSERPRVQVWRA